MGLIMLNITFNKDYTNISLVETPVVLNDIVFGFTVATNGLFVEVEIRNLNL